MDNQGSPCNKRHNVRRKKIRPTQFMCLETEYKMEEKRKIEANFKQSTRLAILLNRPSASHELQIKHSWNSEDCSANIFIEEDGITACRRHIANNTDCVRGKVGFTNGLHIWEITWPSEQRGTHAYVGVATSDATLQCRGYQSLVGLDNKTWGFDINKGITLHDSCIDTFPKQQNGRHRKPYERFRVKFEKIKVILDMDKGTLSFLAGEQYFGEAFNGLKGKKLYPIISAVCGNSRITMKYLGGLDPNPISLQELCKYVICNRISKEHLKEHIKLLQLPKTIEKYLSYQQQD